MLNIIRKRWSRCFILKWWRVTILWGFFRILPRQLSQRDEIKYAGMYVCVPSTWSRWVISANEDPAIALAEAREKWFQDPVCFYVLRPGELMKAQKIIPRPV